MGAGKGRSARFLRALSYLRAAKRLAARQERRPAQDMFGPPRRGEVLKAPRARTEGCATAKENLPFTAEQFAALVRSGDPDAMQQLAAGLATKSANMDQDW